MTDKGQKSGSCRRGRRPRGFRLVDPQKLMRSTPSALSERAYSIVK
jgi:hypothetical protein